MADLAPMAQRYLRFAADEEHGSSPTFDAWSLPVAGDPAVLAGKARGAARGETAAEPRIRVSALARGYPDHRERGRDPAGKQ